MPLKINPATACFDMVTSPGSGTAVISVDVDDNTAPGTDPVVPDGAGLLTISGAVVAAHSVPVETHSRAINSLNVEVQVASTVAAAPGNKNAAGLVQPNSAQFNVDANGYMTLKGDGVAIDTLTGDDSLPVSPDGAGNINVITTDGLATTGAVANTLTISPANDLAAVEALAATGFAVRTGAETWAQRSIAGTADFTTVTNGTGVAGNVVTGIDTNFEWTGMHGWNGSILETAAVSAASDGATILFSVEKSGGGDLHVVFSDGYYNWDTTPAATIALTPGTDTVPTLNYVYFLQSTKTLTVSTVGWPATEHAPLATVLCETAATFSTDGAYKFHAWTDHVTKTTEQGHVGDVNFWIRQQHATWSSGVTQSYNIVANGGAADNVNLDTTAGVVLQLHSHTFPAFTTVHDYYVVNDSVTPFTKVTDLNALLTDSTGASMSGKYFSLVIWGCVSEDTGDCKIYVNLPSGSYFNANSLLDDVSAYSNYTIPGTFTGTGFLISEWKLRHLAAASGTWTSIDEISLLGLFPSLSAEGTGTTVTLTADDLVIVPPAGGTITVAGLSGSKTSGSGSTLTVKSPPYSDKGASATSLLNEGEFITGAFTRTLPASAGLLDGDVQEYICTSASALVIQAVGTQQIRLGNTISSAAGTATSTAIGDSISLRFRKTDGFWYASSVIGNWVLA